MLDNNFTIIFLIFILILYTGIVAPNLPKKLSNLFKNEPFKLFIIFLIVYLSSLNPPIALLISIGFALSIQTQTKNELYDKMVKLINNDIFTNTSNKKVSFKNEPEIIQNYESITNNDLYSFSKINMNNDYEWDFYANDFNYANF